MARLENERSSASKLPVKAQKSRINQLKNELELTLRELAAPAVGAVLGKALEMALAGDKNMIRLILELHMSKPQAQEDATGGKNQVNIQINNLTNKKKPPVEVIDVQATPAGDDRHSEADAQDDSSGETARPDDGK